jgi:hypothetical protein
MLIIDEFNLSVMDQHQSYLQDFQLFPLQITHRSNYHGISYEIHRQISGHLCGYVVGGIEFNLTEDEIEEIEEESCHHDFTSDYFGFDCAHGGDFVPNNPYMMNGVYRDFYYVRSVIQRIINPVTFYAPFQGSMGHLERLRLTLFVN